MRQWILDRWLAYARTALFLAVFLPPVIFWRSTVDVFNLVKMTVILVSGTVALFFWISWTAEAGGRFPFFRLLAAGGAFLAAGLISTVFSENPALSITGLYHRYGGLIPFALYFGVMVLIVGLYWPRPKSMEDIVKASAWAVLIMTSYVFIQEAGLDWIAWRDSAGKPPEFPVGTMGNSNFAGGYLGIAVPFVYAASQLVRREAARIFWLAVAGACLLALYFTQTRGGMIAGGLGILTLTYLHRDRLPRLLKRAIIILTIVIFVASVIVLGDIASARTSGPLSRIGVFRTATLDVRTFYWVTALRIFADNPIVGTGLDTYFANYPKYRLERDGSELGLTITDKPHNIYLEYASNAGIIGLGSYLALVGIGLWTGFRRVRALEGVEKILLSAFLAVLVGYLGQGFFSIDVPPLAITSWIALGGIAVLSDPGIVRERQRIEDMRSAEAKRSKGRGKGKARSRVQNRRAVSPSPVSTGTRWVIHGLGVIAVVLLLLLGTRPLFADVSAKTAAEGQRRQAPAEELRDAIEESIALHPLEPTYRVQAATLQEARASQATSPKAKEEAIKAAIKRHMEAYRLQQGNVFYMLNLGRVYALWGQMDVTKYEEADDWYRRAAEHDPTDWEVHSRYASMLNDWANRAEGDKEIRGRAAKELEQTVELRPDSVDSWTNLAKIYLALDEPAKAKRAAETALKLDPNNAAAREVLVAFQTASG